MYSDMSGAICLFHCTPSDVFWDLVVYCLLITIALDRLSHVSVRLTIVAFHWIDCPYHWIDCRMCQFGLRLSQNTGSILAYHWINCRLARFVSCEYSRIVSYLYILGILVVRIGSKSKATSSKIFSSMVILTLSVNILVQAHCDRGCALPSLPFRVFYYGGEPVDRYHGLWRASLECTKGQKMDDSLSKQGW